jgi:hypothetical protein
MDEARLTALEELAVAASPGPWEFNSYSTVVSVPQAQDYVRLEQTGWDQLPEFHVCYVPSHRGDTATAQGARDAAFIAAAREAVPELVAEVRRLRAVLQQELREWQAEARDADRDCEGEGFDPERDPCFHCYAGRKVEGLEKALKGGTE